MSIDVPTVDLDALIESGELKVVTKQGETLGVKDLESYPIERLIGACIKYGQHDITVGPFNDEMSTSLGYRLPGGTSFDYLVSLSRSSGELLRGAIASIRFASVKA